MPDIRLRATPAHQGIKKKEADRATLIGRSRAGKSTLAAWLVQKFREDHWPNMRILILDTKPRWRATRCLTGSIDGRYAKRAQGDEVESMALDRLQDWPLVWDPKVNPSRAVIMQPRVSRKLDEDVDEETVKEQVQATRLFFQSQDPEIPSLLFVDEGMDFYGPNGNSRFGSAIQKCYRQGGELNLCTLLGSQRPKCINLQTLTEANTLYLFPLAFDDDVKRLQEMGLPKDTRPPKKNHRFLFMRDYELHPKPLMIKPI